MAVRALPAGAWGLLFPPSAVGLREVPGWHTGVQGRAGHRCCVVYRGGLPLQPGLGYLCQHGDQLWKREDDAAARTALRRQIPRTRDYAGIGHTRGERALPELPVLAVLHGGCRAIALAFTKDYKHYDPAKCAFFKGGYMQKLDEVFESAGRPYVCLSETGGMARHGEPEEPGKNQTSVGQLRITDGNAPQSRSDCRKQKEGRPLQRRAIPVFQPRLALTRKSAVFIRKQRIFGPSDWI